MLNEGICCYEVLNCPICNRMGRILYQDQKDRLYGAPGVWNINKCTNNDCESIWLNPCPENKDLHKLYLSYSTHGTPVYKNNLMGLFAKIRKAVLHKELNYPTNQNKFTTFIYNILSHLHPAWRDTQLANVFYLTAKTDGELLDIGCGNGSSMLVMQSNNWNVTGIDFDESAILQAQSVGLNAKVSDLHAANYPDNSFDAIMMNHVIEHVPNPEEFLYECLRILKPNGVLTAMTPNAKAKGHSEFKEDWRGLEVPRHLQIFTPRSLALLANKVGFKQVKGFSSTQGILQIYDESAYCHKNGNFDLSLSSVKNRYLYHIRWFLVGWRHKIKPDISEVAVLKCIK